MGRFDIGSSYGRNKTVPLLTVDNIVQANSQASLLDEFKELYGIPPLLIK